jgi:hypothetical protein
MAGGRISRLGMQRLKPDVLLLILTLNKILEVIWSDPLIN